MEVVIEGVRPEEDLGGSVLSAGPTFAGEGFGEAREASFSVNVKQRLDCATQDGSVVDGVDEAWSEAGEACPNVDPPEGVVGERAQGSLIMMGQKF